MSQVTITFIGYGLCIVLGIATYIFGRKSED